MVGRSTLQHICVAIKGDHGAKLDQTSRLCIEEFTMIWQVRRTTLESLLPTAW